MSNRSSRLLRLAAGAALFLGATLTAAGGARAFPSQVTVQGSLSANDGTPSTGDYTLLVSLYDEQGAATAFWMESHTVTVVDGIFDLALGADVGNPLTIADFAEADEIWLGLQVIGGPGVPAQGEGELPRRLLSSVGFAFAAGYAQTASSADSALAAGALSCTTCVGLAHLDFDPATQAELDALSVPTSVDGLAGGTITSAVVVQGAVTAAALYQDGQVVCDASGNCAAAVPGDLQCSACVDASELSFDAVTVEELLTALAGYAQSSELLPTPPGCSGANQALQWNGTVFSCVTTTPAPPACAGADERLVWDGAAWSCVTATHAPPTPPRCDGAHEALQWDGSAWSCRVIRETGLSGGQAKGYEAVDSWGYAWDGVERQSGTWEAASGQCAQLGARLPTLTELYRVSGAGTNEIGNSYETNYLWSRTPWSATQHGRVRLTDGTTQGQTSTTVSPFRCVWANNTAGSFTGNHCYGPPGAECFAPTTGGQRRYRVDRWERPPAPYMAVIDECNFYHAHVPLRVDYDELIRVDGLGGGTNAWLYTADASRYDIVETVRWTETAPTYDGNASTWVSWAGKTNIYRFRCKGVGYDAGTYPGSAAGAYAAFTTYVTMDPSDRAPGGVVYAEAVGACFDQGGHVGSQRDYEEVVRHGLARTPVTTDWLWTSDASDSANQNIVKWSGVAPSFSAMYSGEATWGGRATHYAYRCAYYPIDADYPGPESCVNGFACFTVERGASGQVKVWADPADRPPETYIDAVASCHAVGARLASSRDYVELVRAGLGVGSGTYLWTSDAVGVNGNYTLIVKWTGVEPDFQLNASGTVNTSKQTKAVGNTSPYRCVWTNELR